MSYTYVTIDGQRVETAVAAAYGRMNSAFKRDTGCSLIISSGTRTYEEQKAIFLARYVLAGQVNGRKVYDTRTWNGQLWYRISSAGTVAVPGTSNHEEDGPNGPRSIDIRDTGSDNGVTVRGTKRDKWMEAHAGEYGFQNEGYNFGEPWHKTFRGDLGSGGGTVTGGTWDAAKKQAFLNSLGYDTGAPGWGPKCAAATGSFQELVGLTKDNDFGPATTAVAQTIEGGKNQTSRPVNAIQQELRNKGFDAGPVDNQWGNRTSLGVFRFQRANNLTADAIYGPATDAKLFPVVTPPTPPVTPPTVPGGNQIKTRAISEIQAFLKVPVTSTWDQATADATKAFQAAMFIDQDYIWGITCDGFAFPPEGMKLFGVDYSFARPAGTTLAQRGVKFAPRYLYNLLQSDGRTNKGLSKAEYDNLNALGIQVPYIYEEEGKELLGGTQAGVRVAAAAETHRNRETLPKKPIYFNVDFDPTTDQFASIMAALDGIASVIGLDRVGLYGGYAIIKAAFDAGKITFGMQTYGWSKGQWDPRAQLRQWSNGQWGAQVDFQYAMADEFGQTPMEDPIPPVEPPVDTIIAKKSDIESIFAANTASAAIAGRLLGK